MMSIVGVSLGVMLLLTVLAILNGLADDLKDRILRTESHIRITKRDGTFFTESELIDSTIRSMPGIRSSASFVQGEVLIISRGTTAGAVLYGVEFRAAGRSDELQNMTSSWEGVDGLLDEGLVIGSLLARRLFTAPGDTILVATPKELLPRPGGRPPKLKQMVVSSVFESGLPEYDAALAFIPVKEAISLLRGQGTSGVEVWLDNPQDAPRTAEKIAGFLDARKEFRVQHWGELNKTLFKALRLEKMAMFLVLALVIIIAALNITGGILRNVMQRRGEIAIVLTMGCRRRSILTVFILEGILTGVVGALLGGFLGIGLSWVITVSGVLSVPGDFLPFPTLPLAMRVMDFILVGLSTVLITTVSAAYPAYKASRMDPVAILRDI